MQYEIDDDDIFDDLDVLENSTSFADVARRVIERVSDFFEAAGEVEATADLSRVADETHDVEEGSTGEPVENQEPGDEATDETGHAAEVAAEDETTNETLDVEGQSEESVSEEAVAEESAEDENHELADEDEGAEPDVQALPYAEVDDEIFDDLDSTTSFADLARRVMEQMSERAEKSLEEEPTADLSSATVKTREAEEDSTEEPVENQEPGDGTADDADHASEVAAEDVPTDEAIDAEGRSEESASEETDTDESVEDENGELADEGEDAASDAQTPLYVEVDDEIFDDLDSTTSFADLAHRVMEQVSESHEQSFEEEPTADLSSVAVETHVAEEGFVGDPAEGQEAEEETTHDSDEADAEKRPVFEIFVTGELDDEYGYEDSYEDANPELAYEGENVEPETQASPYFEVDDDEIFADLDSTVTFADLARRVMAQMSEREEQAFEEEPTADLSSAKEPPVETEETAGSVSDSGTEEVAEDKSADQSLETEEEREEAVAVEADGEEIVVEGVAETADVDESTDLDSEGEGEGIEPVAQTPAYYFEVDDDDIFDDIEAPDNTTSFADVARRVIEQVAEVTEESSEEPVEDTFEDDPTVDLSAALAAARSAKEEPVSEETPEVEEMEEQGASDSAIVDTTEEDESAEPESEEAASEIGVESEDTALDAAEADKPEFASEDSDIQEQVEEPEPALEVVEEQNDEAVYEAEETEGNVDDSANDEFDAEAGSSDVEAEESYADSDTTDEDVNEDEVEAVEEDESAGSDSEDETSDVEEPTAESEADETEGAANAISFDGEIDNSEVVDEKIFDGLYIIPEGTPSEADAEEDTVRGGVQEPEDELSSVLNVSALIEEMYRQEVERSAPVVNNKPFDEDEDDIDEPDLEGLVRDMTPVTEDEASDEGEPEAEEDTEGVEEEEQRQEREPSSDFVPVEVDDDDIFEDIDLSSALSAASVMFPVVYEEVRPEDDAELMRQATIDVEPAVEAKPDDTGSLADVSEGVVKEVLPVETIYNEDQIREAVENASQNDSDVDPTLVLDEAAEAVRRLRTVEEKVVASAQAKAQETNDAPERDIHAEYIATIKQTERLEASYDPVSKTGDSKILKALGGGKNNVFEHIGAFVVKVLRLDDKQG